MVLQNNCDIAEQLWYCKFIFATLAKILKLSGLQKLVADLSLIIGDIQFFALENFRFPLGFLKSFPSGNIVYIEINSDISLNEDALLNSFVFWIKISINIIASHSDMPKGILYTRVVKSSLIISVISLERHFFSFITANTCFSNTTVLAV